MASMPARDIAEQLRAFRATHPVTRREVAGVWWEYIICGSGSEALLMLPGAPGWGETAFPYILAMEGSFRIIAPSLPAQVRSLAPLLDGLAAILAAEECGRVHVIGGSYGGMLAQGLLRRHTEKVAKLVLSHTGVPCRCRARRHRRYYYLVAALPFSLTRRLLLFALTGFFFQLREDRRFWWRYFREMSARLSKQACLARLSVSIDWDHQPLHAVASPFAEPGHVLIIEADDDPLVNAAERGALRAAYPRARVHTFQKTGHAAWITRQQEYQAVMLQFLQQPVHADERLRVIMQAEPL